MTETLQIPEQWLSLLIGEIADVVAGGTPKASDPDNFAEPGTQIAWLTPADLSKYSEKYISHGARDLSKAGYESSSAKLMPGGTLLFSSRAPIGYVAVAANEICTNQGFKNFVLPAEIDPSYAYYFLRSIRDVAESMGTGTTFKEISGANAKKLPFILPPLAEQKVIADKLDTLLAQVENTKAERSFKKLGEAGVDVKTGPFGSALHKSDYVIGGIPVINPMHISEGTITPSNSMTISQQKYMSLEAWHLRKGDVVVGRRGEMGRASVVTSDEPQLCGTGSMILRVGNDALPKYLEIILRSPTAVSYFNSASVGSTMVNLNQKVIKNLEVYFPSLDEQTEIVRRVDQLFAHADRIEQQINNALARVNNLTQSILAKAFRGELTAQWRKDNPELISGENSAAALLERIKAERAAAKTAKKTRKKASS